MTTEEYKKLKPEHAHLEGDALWDAMTEYMLRLQQGDCIIKTIKPFYKRYKLRYLFYYRTPNILFRKNNYSATKRCSKCKKGVSNYLGFISQKGYKSFCPHCRENLVQETNTNLNHITYKKLLVAKEWLWQIIEFTHLVKRSIHGRYEIFGDESHYVKSWHLDMNTCKSKAELKNRKWREYIFIKK